uniref:Uncharacterized protein n=1 Tax=Anguilla anguilla TaxID=7936 RepID=A0A0E9PU19_ANGAN
MGLQNWPILQEKEYFQVTMYAANF